MILRFAGPKNIENMTPVELSTELVEREDFAPRVLQELNRPLLEEEVEDAREEVIETKQIWISQVEQETFTVVGKGTSDDTYLMKSLKDGREHWVDFNTLKGPNWTRIATQS